MSTTQEWTKIIKPKPALLDLNFKEIWNYRDLIRMFVFRDFVTFYKQTILGPIWFFIQPIITAFINLVIFAYFAGINPSGTPAFLFYLSGPILWQYFQESFTKTAGAFKDNQNIFGKVYFPRIIMPLSIVISNLMKFGVQLGMLLLLVVYYYLSDGVLYIQKEVYLFPLLLIIVIIMALGFGLLITSLTTKYRDLKFMIDFGVPLFKYITPGIASSYLILHNRLQDIGGSDLSWLIKYNPVGSVLDAYNYIFTGAGEIDAKRLMFSGLFGILVLLFGMLVFNRTEKTFMDTV